MPKHDLRYKTLKKRTLLDSSIVAEKSRSICRIAMEHPWFRAANKVALYWPIRNEVDTAPFLFWAKREGKELFLPKVRGDHLDFYSFRSEEDLRPGAFKIPEPFKGDPVQMADIDLWVVPGVVFDRTGHRLGYGRGFYDRLFAEKTLNCKCVGLAYDFQVVDEIITEDHDCPVDIVITDNGVLEKALY